MKKLLLLTLATAAFTGSFAQRTSTVPRATQMGIYNLDVHNYYNTKSTARTTASGDTLILSNIDPASDTPTLFLAGVDSGYLTGTDAYGDMGYAERYDFNGSDSTLEVIGVKAIFAGRYSDTTTKKVNFKVWDIGSQNTADPNYTGFFYSGLPNNTLDSLVVPINLIGINDTNNYLDTFKAYLFTSPTAYLDSSFYVGYEINYIPTALKGDTIGLLCSLDGERTSSVDTVLGAGDTVINVQNATEFSGGGGWNDNVFDNDGIQDNLYIFPIVVVKYTTGVSNVRRNNLTFYGNFPNPATNSTNIRFSLATEVDVTVQIEDLNGNIINTIKQSKLSAGEHIIPVNTSKMAAGDYLYIIRTSGGDGIGSKMSVIK